MTRITIATAAMWLLITPALLADDLEKMKEYEYGGDQASLLAVERQVEASMADPAAQRRMAARLLDVMTDARATFAAKQHAAILLRMCGTGAEVPALANMLGQGPLGDCARGTLERIPGEAAGKALRDAVETLQGPALVAVIHSTANRRDRQAVGALVRLTQAKDGKVAAAAAHALGQIGGPEATACLKKLAAGAKDPELAQAYLSCGTLALAAGDKPAAAEVFAALADARYPAAVRRGALLGQIALSGDPGALIAQWLDGDDAAARRAAADSLVQQPTAWLLEAARAKPPAKAIALAEVLAARGELAARPILIQAAGQKEDEVLRARAMMAMAKVADHSCVALLIDALAESGETGRAAMTVLSTMPSTLIDEPVMEAYRGAQGRQRERLADLLIARRMTKAVAFLLELAKVENDAALRDSVSSALVALGDEKVLPGLVQVLLAAEDAKHRDKLETTYLEIAKDCGNTVEPILAAMTDETRSIRLLPLLGRVGGEGARRRIAEAVASSKEELKAAGVRALCNWPNAEVADQLAALARNDANPGAAVAALRAYIRVVTLKSDRPESDTLAMLQKAYGMAQRDDEKRLAVTRAEAVRHIQTLRWLVGLLDQEAVREEACSSIVELAHHRDLRNPNRNEFAKALRKVIELSKDRSTVGRAKGYLLGV